VEAGRAEVTGHIDLLRDLCLAPGPTGFEAAPQEVVRTRLWPLGEAAGDPLGNVWLGVGPEGGPQVAVAAHADQTGTAVCMLLCLDTDLTAGQLDELRDWVRDKYGG
jgi:hypothetical protein